MRDNRYLQSRLDFIWRLFFADIKRENEVKIQFGRKAHRRLGSIRATSETPIKTKILINGFLKDQVIPSFIIDATIAHELCHYAHGFASPLPKLYKYPHKGGQIEKEMESRGLGALAADEQIWLNKNWFAYCRSHA